MAKTLPKDVLEAGTDETLALAARLRAGGDLADGLGAFVAMLSEGMAAMLAEEFPGVPGLGRVAASVAAQVLAMHAGTAEESGVHLDLSMASTILALAGEQLDREARDG
jgi:hypothetical protein